MENIGKYTSTGDCLVIDIEENLTFAEENPVPDSMIHVSRTPKFSTCGTISLDPSPMETTTDQDQELSSAARHRRPRSHSYYSPEDAKKYGIETATDENFVRPRSRSFYSYETSELHREGNFTRSNAMRPRSNSLEKSGDRKTENSADGNQGIMARLNSKRSKSNTNKHLPCRDLNGMQITVCLKVSDLCLFDNLCFFLFCHIPSVI